MGNPAKRKAAVLQKMLPQNNKPIAQSAREGIAQDTLYSWRTAARTKGQLMPDGNVTPLIIRPSVSNDSLYSESLFKTLKYTPAYLEKSFESLQAARDWVHTFVHRYSEEHFHSEIRFVILGSRHRGEDITILMAREAIYLATKAKHPERWSKEIKCLQPVGGVWSNSDQES